MSHYLFLGEQQVKDRLETILERIQRHEGNPDIDLAVKQTREPAERLLLDLTHHVQMASQPTAPGQRVPTGDELALYRKVIPNLQMAVLFLRASPKPDWGGARNEVHAALTPRTGDLKEAL